MGKGEGGGEEGKGGGKGECSELASLYHTWSCQGPRSPFSARKRKGESSVRAQAEVTLTAGREEGRVCAAVPPGHHSPPPHCALNTYSPCACVRAFLLAD